MSGLIMPKAEGKPFCAIAFTDKTIHFSKDGAHIVPAYPKE